MTNALIGIIDMILYILMWIIIGQVVLSWLLAFNVINPHSQGVRGFISGLDRFLDPLYRPIRRILPDFGGIDFSPLVILLIIAILRTKILPGILMELGPTIT
jgi:YggT family protein